MLSMPSVSPTSNLVTRPVLVAEAVRPAAPMRAIEPTTAISKERSRAENPAADASTRAASAVYTAAGTQAQRTDGKRDLSAQAEQQAAQEAKDKEQPPVEKSEIQKAMETQIKDLLVNVWKASARAVDFLLQRDSESTESGSRISLTPAELLGKKAKDDKDAQEPGNTTATLMSYTAQGGKLSEEKQAAGQLIDVLA